METAFKSPFASAALLAVLCLPAQAAGERNVLKNSVLSNFTDEDAKLMKARVREALTAEREGEPLAWKNDQTEASGSVTPLNRLQWNGLDCRRLRIVNRYRESTASGDDKFCQKPPGTWKQVGPDPSPG